jgi:hypothetical protein
MRIRCSWGTPVSRRWPLLLGALGLAIAVVRPDASSQEPPTGPPPRVLPGGEPARKPELQGAGSCASAACHNGPGIGMLGREYAVALERDRSDLPFHYKDKHAQAYDVLFSPLARQMEAALHPGAAPRPEMNEVCLRCHVHPAFDSPTRLRDGVAQFRLEDGVSCEACHGPAEHWLASHFRSAGTTNLLALGQADTRSLPGRMRGCVDCHVGAAGMDVNHDLIAAGHPRLSFEFASFHFLLHKHWDYAKDRDPTVDARGRRDFEARAWLLGQLASARAALTLLADRADPAAGRPWPEFAEYDCNSCHHDLSKPGWRAASQAGTLVPSDWYTSLLPDAFAGLDIHYDPEVRDAVSAVRTAMSTNRPNRRAVAEKARRAAVVLDQRLRDANNGPGATVPVAELLGRIARNAREQATHSADEAAQLYLGVHALRRARADLGILLTPLRLPGLRGLLQFPPARGDSVEFSEAALRAALRAALDALKRNETR